LKELLASSGAADRKEKRKRESVLEGMKVAW